MIHLGSQKTMFAVFTFVLLLATITDSTVNFRGMSFALYKKITCNADRLRIHLTDSSCLFTALYVMWGITWYCKVCWQVPPKRVGVVWISKEKELFRNNSKLFKDRFCIPLSDQFLGKRHSGSLCSAQKHHR